MNTIVIVGFKVSQERSVFYRKVSLADRAKLFDTLLKAFAVSDFVSIRIIRRKESVR